MPGGPGGRYGSCAGRAGAGNKDEAPATAAPAKPKAVPFFLENPDGSIAEAVPWTHKAFSKALRCGSFRPQALAAGGTTEGSDSDSGASNTSNNSAASLQQEVEFLYNRHALVFTGLLIAQFMVDMLYCYVSVRDIGKSVKELRAMYRTDMDQAVARSLFWTILAIQIVYVLFYYTLAGLALWTRKPKWFRQFANCSISGAVFFVFLAYVDKFNLPIFFIRLLAYIYGRFLQGLTASLLLLPPPTAPATMP